MPLWNGGIIGVTNNPSNTTAIGAWGLAEQSLAQKDSNWPTTTYSIELLVIAGGGGGGGYIDGGGGAGGLLYYGAETPKTPNGSAITIEIGTSFTVTVGGGGTGFVGFNGAGTKGSNSLFSATYTATGGGGCEGGASNRNGGSGGGAGHL